MVASTRTVLFWVSLSGVCGREELLPLLVHREPLAELSKSLSSSSAPKRSRCVPLPVEPLVLPLLYGEGEGDVFLGRGVYATVLSCVRGVDGVEQEAVHMVDASPTTKVREALYLASSAERASWTAWTISVSWRKRTSLLVGWTLTSTLGGSIWSAR